MNLRKLIVLHSRPSFVVTTIGQKRLSVGEQAGVGSITLLNVLLQLVVNFIVNFVWDCGTRSWDTGECGEVNQSSLGEGHSPLLTPFG